MKKISYLRILVVMIPVMVTGCAHNVSPQVSMRTYSNVSNDVLTKALGKAFVRAGYLTEKSELSQASSTIIKDGVKKETVSYTYGPAKLPGTGRYSCMKLATAKVNVLEKTMHLVSLESLDVTCYPSIGKMDFAIDTDKVTYERFFNALSDIVGAEGQRVGAGN